MQINQLKSLFIGLLAASLLAGCATTQSSRDPLEGVNRGIYKFNDMADKAVLKPVAGVYKAVVPDMARSGIGNFFSNLGEAITVANDLLQFKFDDAMTGAGRFAINSTFGVGGLIDWASKDGIQRHKEDFGQTLGAWGWKDSSYLVLPLFGPSTVRDTTGELVDGFAFDPIGYAHPRQRNILNLTKGVDKRAQYLPGSDLLDEAALDPYIFMRDAYMQRRNAQITDGEGKASDDSIENDADMPAPK